MKNKIFFNLSQKYAVGSHLFHMVRHLFTLFSDFMAKNPVLERHGFRSMLGAAAACAVQSVRIQAWLMAYCTRAVIRNRPASPGDG